MSTAVMINLDYLLSPAEACQKTWQILHQSFIDAGFCDQDRLFTISQPYNWGSVLAEEAMRVAAVRLKQHGLELASIVRTCQAFEFQQVHPIETPAPVSAGIEVSFMETGAWQVWQSEAAAH